MSYLHNLSPFAIQFTETFGVRWYGLAYLSGFIFGYYVILKMTKLGGTLFKENQIADFTTYCAIGVLVGGRIGYVLFYAPDLLMSFDSHFPYWGVLKVNQGGMASHGGILGVILVTYLFARRHKIPFLHCMDLVSIGGAIGFMFGRIANYINGELFGRAASEGFRWAVKFPSEMYLWLQKDFPKMKTLAPAVDALREFKTPDGQLIKVDSATWMQWLESYGRDGMARVHVQEAIEGLIAAVHAGQTEVVSALGLVLTPRHASQLYQSFLEGFLVLVALCWIWRKPRKMGVVAGWFGILYCTGRIIGEQFRMPDAHLGYQLLGLTRGQWLSVGLLLIGVTWLVVALRLPGEKMGGWNPGLDLAIAPAKQKTKKIKKSKRFH